MAAYPSLPIAISSTATRLHGFIPVRATNGDLKVRKTMSGEKMEFDVVHELTSAQKTTLEGHYTGDKLNSFSFTWPTTGTAYTVRYTSAPQYQEQPGGWYKARVKLAEA